MSLPRYNNYKDSGVKWLGKVPCGWGVRRIRHLFEIRKRICGAVGHEVLSITQQGIKAKDIESGDGQLSADYSKYQCVEVGDFAMNHMDLLTGYVDISPVFGVTSPDYRVFAVRDKEVCFDRYYLYLFQAGYKDKIFYAFGQGSSQLGRWRFPTDEFNSFEFPLPPMVEQKEIVAFLDYETAKIDALLVEQRRLLELLSEKRQAALSQAVTKGLNSEVAMKNSGVAWLGKVPVHWELMPLKRDMVFLTSGSRGWADHYSEDGALFIRIGNLTREGIGLDLSDIQRVSVPEGTEGERTRVQPGDVLFSITAYLGSVAVVSEHLEPAYVSQHVALVRLRRQRLLPKWAAYVALSIVGKTYLEMQGYGGTKIQLSLDDVANLPMTVPDISEQAEIIKFLDQQNARFDALAAEAESAIALLQERRTALISAAVTGKIDVRGLVGVHLEEVAAE
jgi:type I restriction enzyme S subunit